MEIKWLAGIYIYKGKFLQMHIQWGQAAKIIVHAFSSHVFENPDSSFKH